MKTTELEALMNELGLDGPGSRQTSEYAQFARTLYAAVRDLDPTRPVIENDWVEPDPDRVFSSPILTAHWYGRLHADYLEKLERESRRWAGTGRPFFVSEFGDWGLPMMPEHPEPPFWDALKEIAAERALSVQALIGDIDAGRGAANLSSAIRIFVLREVRAR